MPASHQRHKPKHHHQAPHKEHKKRKITAALFLMVMFGIFGLSIAYFTSGRDSIWSLVGTIGGMVIGYFFGHNMDNAARKKV